MEYISKLSFIKLVGLQAVLFILMVNLKYIIFVTSQSQRNMARRNTWHGHYLPADDRSYGEYCNEKQNLNCDKKALLMCHGHICACTQHEQMIFDSAKGQCVSKAGAKCLYARAELDQNIKTEKIPCVLNGFCGTKGICECLPGFYNSFNVTCLTQKGFETPCHYDFECRADYHLRCITGICQCDPAVSIKHGSYELCLGLAGERAIEGNCVEFTDRVPATLGKSNMNCECLENYVKGPDKKCHGDIDQACTIESPCLFNYSCIQGTCKCPFPDYQTYSVKTATCLSNVFGPCDSSLDCGPGTFCNTNGTYNHCDCSLGFVLGASQACEKSIGTSCRVSKNMDLVVDECSSSSLLQCRNGKCSCADFKVFSEEDEKCVGLVGSICFRSDEINPPICIEHSSCVYKYERLGFGLCTCEPGFAGTSERFCLAMPNISTTEETFVGSASGEDASTVLPDYGEVDEVVEIETTTVKLNGGRTDNATVERMNKNLLEFYKFLNDTLYGGFDNASFTRFMNENFNLPGR